MIRWKWHVVGLSLTIVASSSSLASAKRWKPSVGHKTQADAQIKGLNGGVIDPVFTVGERIGRYFAPGILDGMAAFRRGNRVQILVNHELTADAGYEYELANGTRLTGARITSFMFHRKTRRILRAGVAYDTIYNRAGELVDEPGDLDNDAIGRLCSARGVNAGERGFEDDIFFTGEEIGEGTEFVLDVQRREIWAAPELGRASWEAVAAVDTGDANTTGLLIGDDFAPAPLYYWEGTKNGKGNGSFLDRNGLAEGQLFCWASITGEANPDQFHGTGSTLSGEWLPINTRDETMAGTPGYDVLGYKDAALLREEAFTMGCFAMSRPEDVHENPRDPKQVVVASTGRGGLFPADNWGVLYIVDVQSANLEILVDTDDSQFQDFGVRSPDNLVWSQNGKIYVQEDRSTAQRVPKDPSGCAADGDPQACLNNAFGGRSKIEASIWEIDPYKPINSTLDLTRVAVVDRSARLPEGQEDTDPLDLGDWETSGIIDVTKMFPTWPGRSLLFGNVQAHSVQGGAIDRENLVQGGQLYFLSIPSRR